jgi:hypothetical protein
MQGLLRNPRLKADTLDAIIDNMGGSSKDPSSHKKTSRKPTANSGRFHPHLIELWKFIVAAPWPKLVTCGRTKNGACCWDHVGLCLDVVWQSQKPPPLTLFNAQNKQLPCPPICLSACLHRLTASLCRGCYDRFVQLTRVQTLLLASTSTISPCPDVVASIFLQLRAPRRS